MCSHVTLRNASLLICLNSASTPISALSCSKSQIICCNCPTFPPQFWIEMTALYLWPHCRFLLGLLNSLSLHISLFLGLSLMWFCELLDMLTATQVGCAPEAEWLEMLVWKEFCWIQSMKQMPGKETRKWSLENEYTCSYSQKWSKVWKNKKSLIGGGDWKSYSFQ